MEPILAELAALPGVAGYVTQTFCTESRYFQPHNGARVDAIRDAIDAYELDAPIVGSVPQLWGRSEPNLGFGPALAIPELDDAVDSLVAHLYEEPKVTIG